jgi:hypothetical protein
MLKKYKKWGVLRVAGFLKVNPERIKRKLLSFITFGVTSNIRFYRPPLSNFERERETERGGGGGNRSHGQALSPT